MTQAPKYFSGKPPTNEERMAALRAELEITHTKMKAAIIIAFACLGSLLFLAALTVCPGT